MALLYLDTLGYVKKAKELGENEALAEHHVRFIEQALDLASKKNNHFASKEDVKESELKLTKEIREIELKLTTEIHKNRTEIEVIRKNIREIELNLKTEIKDAELRLTREINNTRVEIKEVELRLQKSINGMTVKLLFIFGGGFLTMVSIIAKGFHWF
jgi:predicted phage-related endonuclease